MNFHPSVEKALSAIKSAHPGAKFFAFGQTVFWDEPMKSVLLPMLDAYYPEGAILAGAHDADYFGRCAGFLRTERFVTCEHNDGPTRDMWAAVGEMAALFGGEVVPTHAALESAGVSFRRLRQVEGRPYDELIRECTTAWGWRAVVEAGRAHAVFHDIATDDVKLHLRNLIEWALGRTLSQVEGPDAEKRKAVASRILEEFEQQSEKPEFKSLSALYQSLWPRLYGLVSGHETRRLSVSSTFDLFRFNRQTCSRPRFRIVDLFLQPETSAVCRAAYSAAVAGTGIYPLERFGPGALPCELVVPGRGRGLIVIDEKRLIVRTSPEIVVDLPRPPRSASELADAVEAALGPNVALIGKAVIFAYMITSEFVFVLNEKGSVYVASTKKFGAKLKEAGIDGRLCPILRLRHHTWDSLKGVPVRLKLPEHLAAGFGAPSIEASDFAARWRDVVREQSALMDKLHSVQSPRDMMRMLAQGGSNEWRDKLGAYEAAQHKLLCIQRDARCLKQRAETLKAEWRLAKAALPALYALRGKVSRLVKPLRRKLLELERAGAPETEIGPIREELNCYADAELPQIDAQIVALTKRIEELRAQRAHAVQSFRNLEKGTVARECRRIVASLGLEINVARLRLASRAFRITRGLPYSDARPTAWWLPVVDPSGRWFRNVIASTELTVEPMEPGGVRS